MDRKNLALGVALGLSTACATTPLGDGLNSDILYGESQGVDHDLARINALEIVSVGALIVDLPEGYGSCYGPCPDDEERLAEEEAAQMERLAAFAAVAEAAVAEEGELQGACAMNAIDDNLAALEGLRIVEVTGLAEAWPEAEANCYNLPCDSEDYEDYCERASDLARMVDGSEGL